MGVEIRAAFVEWWEEMGSFGEEILVGSEILVEKLQLMWGEITGFGQNRWKWRSWWWWWCWWWHCGFHLGQSLKKKIDTYYFGSFCVFWTGWFKCSTTPPTWGFSLCCSPCLRNVICLYCWLMFVGIQLLAHICPHYFIRYCAWGYLPTNIVEG